MKDLESAFSAMKTFGDVMIYRVFAIFDIVHIFVIKLKLKFYPEEKLIVSKSAKKYVAKEMWWFSQYPI